MGGWTVTATLLPSEEDEKQGQKKPAEKQPEITLPGDYFDRPQGAGRQGKQNEPIEVPKNFFNLPFDQQQQYMQEPDTLPEDLPERTLKTVGRAAPYVAATVGGLAAPEIAGPWWLGLLARGGIAAASGAAGSGVQSGIYSSIGDEEAPSSIGEAVKRAGIEGAVQGGTEIGLGLATKPIGIALKKAFNPESLYQRGLKPPAGRGQAVSGKIVKTGIDEGIWLSEGGAAKLAGKINQVNTDIENMIAGSPTNISPSDYVKNIQTRLDALRKRYKMRATTGKQAIATIDEAERRFLIDHGGIRPLNVFKGYDANGKPIYALLKPEDMTLNMLRQRAYPISSIDAQQIKKETYEELRSMYKSRGQMVNIPGWSPGTHPGVALETTQEITRALREELGNIYPGLHKLNAKDGALIDLDEVINRYINREMNRGLWRWGTALSAGGALVSAGAHGTLTPELLGLTAAGLVKGALDNPGVLSYLAIALNKASTMPGRGIVTRLGREALPTAARAQEYISNEGWPRVTVVDPSDVQRPPRAEGQPPKTTDTAAAWKPEWSNMMADSAKRIGVPLPLMKVIAEREGSVAAARQQNVAPNEVRSKKGAVGLMQVMPDTAGQFGYSKDDLTDPAKNIDAAARTLKALLATPEYRNKPGLVLAAYNAGPGAVKAAGYNVARMSKETRDYVRQGLKRWAELGLPAEQAAIVDVGER